MKVELTIKIKEQVEWDSSDVKSYTIKEATMSIDARPATINLILNALKTVPGLEVE